MTTVKLRPGATDLAEFASDLAACVEGRMTAEMLAESYLDQNLADDAGLTFDEAVKAFTETAAYYC